MENPLKGIRLYSLTIEYDKKLVVQIYDQGKGIAQVVKKALRNGHQITINGRTIWRENHSVGIGPNHDYIWDKTGEKIQVQEILKVRNDKTNDELKIIRGRLKFMSYALYNEE